MVVMHTFSLESSFKYIMWVRVLQASGLAFLFIPINTISYTGVTRWARNDLSGLTILARNIGESTGDRLCIDSDAVLQSAGAARRVMACRVFAVLRLPRLIPFEPG